MAARATSPVAALKEQIVALEAALAVCGAEPKPDAVHRFRSTSRRIEAILLLLETQHQLPPFRTASARLNHELRKLRRTAGHVRDHDVHLKLLRARLRRITEEDERRSAHQVIDHIFAERQSAATRFHKLLNGREAKLATRLEELRKALHPAEGLCLSASAYIDAAHTHVQRHAHLPRAAAGEGATRSPEVWARLEEDELHDVRKAAKIARYMLEPAPATVRVREAGKRYHAIQNAGGNWHDWLEVTRAARRLLGRNHPFTVALKEARNRHHAGFLRSLETLL